MKKCESFKDLILTDYIDGELDKDAAGRLESHLLDCQDCRAFLKTVKDHAAQPFVQASRQDVPLELWDTIKQNIESKDQAASPLADFMDGLKGWMAFPRMVPVFASLTLMFLAGSVTLNTMHVQQAQAKDQGEYLTALLSPADLAAQPDNNDEGTPMERYFL